MAINDYEIGLGLSDDELDVTSQPASISAPKTTIADPPISNASDAAAPNASNDTAGVGGNDDDAAMMAAMGFTAFADPAAKHKPSGSDGKRKRPRDLTVTAFDTVPSKKQRTPPVNSQRQTQNQSQQQQRMKGANAVPIGQRRPLGSSGAIQISVDEADHDGNAGLENDAQNDESTEQERPEDGTGVDDESTRLPRGVYFKASFIEDPWRGLVPMRFEAVGR